MLKMFANLGKLLMRNVNYKRPRPRVEGGFYNCYVLLNICNLITQKTFYRIDKANKPISIKRAFSGYSSTLLLSMCRGPLRGRSNLTLSKKYHIFQ